MESSSSLGDSASRTGNDANPKKATDTKRVLACGTCRKRKLKCDSKRPKCSTCERLGHPCEYDEVRKKSGPKRGYVKSLEARLNQLESLLDGNQKPTDQPPAQSQDPLRKVLQQPLPSFVGPQTTSNENTNTEPEIFPQTTMTDTDLNLMSDFGVSVENFNWDMVSLGLEEPLPSQDIMDELFQIYFDKVHSSFPMVHRTRFLASLNLAPNSRPPVCLRYIMFAHACSVDTRYHASADQFYQKSRKYIEQDEMRGHGENFVSIAHAQTWNMIGAYEFKYMYFPRAWLSVGRGGRLVQLLGLHRQDHVGMDVKQTLGPPKDWADREERRRTFWVAYCHDRYASIGTGWPMMFDEQDILTSLPASDQAFASGRPERTPELSDVMAGDKITGLSSFACVVMMATLFGRNLTHLHRQSTDDDDHDLNGEFWKRHRSLDNILLNVALSLPSHLRLPQGINDANIIFANMEIHTSTICLHQAAIFKADKHKLAGQISSESKRRCLVAADQITNLMKMICHLDLSALNPFLAFSLYVAARVFVQYLKFKKGDLAVRSSLLFLLQAMKALKIQNPLTESFLVQLDVDLEGSGIDVPMAGVSFGQKQDYDASGRKCGPLVEVRDPFQGPTEPAKPEPSTFPHEMKFQESDFDPASYFAPRTFERSGSNSGPGHILNNGLTPSSTSLSNSNQATPSGSSNQRRASSSATSPPTSDLNNNAPPNPDPAFPNSGNPFLHQTIGTTSDGIAPPQFNMDMEERNQQSQPASIPPNQRQSQTRSPSTTDASYTMKTMPYNMDLSTDDMGQQQNHNPAGFLPNNMDSTGLSPMPLPSGFTPGPTGLTPGHFGLTPSSEWANINNIMEDNEWMFEQ